VNSLIISSSLLFKKFVENKFIIFCVSFPSINIPTKGTVFLNGTSKENCFFSGIKTKPLTKKEQKEPRWKGQTHKSDTETLQNFGPSGFYDACEYIGLFDLETTEE
jgi:hypothetical protein